MKILLSAPYTRRTKDNLILKAQEILKRRQSLALGILSALTPEQHEIEIIDENNYSLIDTKKQYDLVAISSITPHIIRAYKIADEFRARGIPVVLGGYHPSAMPEEAKQHADAVVIGEAEETWPQLLKDFENDKLKPFYKPRKPVDPKIIPHAKRDPKRGFFRTEEIQATRGCPYRCDFCAIQNTEGHIFRKRPVENVIDEIQKLNGKFIFFNDNSLTIDPEYTKELFMEMKGLNKQFECHGNINVLGEDDELLKLSKEAGCKTWWIGFESISQESINSIGKKTNIVKKYSIAIKKIKKHGLSVRGMFVFGFDGDTKNIFKDTLKTLKTWNIDIAYFFILTPFPNTPLFERLENEERILTKDWSKYNYGNVVFKPKNMTSKELYEKTRMVAKNFYSFKNSVQRIFNNKNLDFSGLINKFWHNFLYDRNFIKREYQF